MLADRIYNDEVEDPCLTGIDKSWAGILFLITGQSIQNLLHPLGSILFSGQLIDEAQNLGYGPAHYVTPEQVKTFALELSKISVQALSEKFDPEQMNELQTYPEIWEGEDDSKYLLEHFKTVQCMYLTAAEKGEAIITFLN